MQIKDLSLYLEASPSELAVIQMALKEFIPKESKYRSDYHIEAERLLKGNERLWKLAWEHWFDAP